MRLSPLQQDFVLHFGEMGSRWGINRTVGQMYALLFLEEEPLNADQIAEALGFSRSNVSMGLKELQAWNLVRLRHLPGDRRDYFTTPDDVWEIVRTLVAERKKREIGPTLSKLREIQLREPESGEDAYAYARIAELGSVIEMLTGWYDEMNVLETTQLLKILSMGGDKARRIIKATDKMVSLGGAFDGGRGKGRNRKDT